VTIFPQLKTITGQDVPKKRGGGYFTLHLFQVN